ncbi:MAG TPA: FtsW/RodA/SpoVE family cell cycle protein [Candidatus Limnocylindrales bacterium]|jgi:cell division protein FtsW (lipid II flippase)|nr:FtsW/RodA/SpoVE family cell cycle protein [Candidatus Limnocylindrales bacterium]
MSVVARAPASIRTEGRQARRFILRPRFRGRELGLLGVVAVGLYFGAMSLGATERFRDALANGADGPLNLTSIAEPGLLLTYLAALFGVHAVFVLAGRRTDQLLLPTVGLLGGIGLLLMIRLPQNLAGNLGGLAQTQLIWLLIGLGIVTVLGVAVRNDVWLRRYKYTWAAVGVGLLLLTFVFGNDVNGARLTLSLGPISGQPSELLKVILVIFLAGYLSENRPLLVEESTRIGPIRLPPLPYLAPMVAMWTIALGIVIVQRDLGAALLFFAVFLLLLYVSTARVSFVVLGLVAFVAGAVALYFLFAHVRVRVDVWLDPFADPAGAGYQVVQALHAFARGGLIGTGLGAGLPTVGGRPPIPALHTDFPFAALGEELGLVGILAILGLYLVLVQRGLRIASAAQDEFRAILAAGLSLVIGVQAFIIAGGNLKLIPLTGITLPFISYGGSSLLANAVIVGLLIALSERGREPLPPPRRPGRLRRLLDRGAA